MGEFIYLNKEGKERWEFDTPGEYVVFFHNLSGNFTFVINAPRVKLDIFGIIDGKNDAKYHIQTTQLHNAPHSTSNLLIRGVFTDQSQLHYQGLVRIEKQGQGSHAYQKNQNLLMSDLVFVESKPYLEILANDVYCTHGSTTGKINKDELYYLQSRGLIEQQARRTIVNGFLSEVIEQVRTRVPQFSLPYEYTI
ncbi:SufD family Fe-S cluster assembly protein [Candidatus Roizmanbacteria bacterium]|nr:SufD family Fe-S cluster assembly protein [Candidatus Roizmanbacteria bacterium]